MTKKFFVSWQAWEKLVFILACAIVLTVLFGCMKLAYTHWRLGKYAAVEKENKEQSMQRQLSLRRKASGSDDIPFGIRAIESGIQVEGVWISPAHTPENRSRETSAASSMRKHMAGQEYDIDIEKQDQNRGHDRSASSSTTATHRPGRSSLDQVTFAEKLPMSHNSRESSPERPSAKPPRSRHPPLSYTKYSGNPYILRNSSATNTLEGLEAIHKASTSMRDSYCEGSTGSNDSSNRSSDSTGGIEPIAASAPDLLNTQLRHKRRQNSSSSDLDLLNSHRISQAAEIGQLTPRGRRPGKSYSAEFARVSSSRRTSASIERGDFLGAQSKRAAPPQGQNFQTGSLSIPKFDILPAAVRRTSMPDITPFALFCKTAPPTPSLDGSKKSRMESDRFASNRESQGISGSSPPSPIMPASAGATELKLPPPIQLSFEKPSSTIMRGHGSGFEILKPGTLNPPIPPPQQKKTAPPVSLHNHCGKTSSSMDERRRLQKKRRPSVDSSASSSKSRLSLISLS